ncbi:MAG: hypothetical protein IH627_23025 [Rubrivivax sp.]|nr:hypothetical protein [Rubrivivax sp.]
MSPTSSPARDRGTGKRAALVRTVQAFAQMLPILVGMLLLTSLLLAWLPRSGLQGWFGQQPVLDVLLGAAVGSVAMGHPLAGYILGGELLDAGVSLVAVTALIVSWVTVGVVQLPAEALVLGRRFALTRNLLCFVSAIAVAHLTVLALRLIG